MRLFSRHGERLPQLHQNGVKVGKLLCGTSLIEGKGKGVGYHGGTGVSGDKYGSLSNFSISGKEVIQLRALGDTIRLRLVNNEHTLDKVSVIINNSLAKLSLNKDVDAYELVSKSIAKLFVDGEKLTVIEAKPI